MPRGKKPIDFKKAEQIREDYINGFTYDQIVKAYKCSKSTVRAITKGYSQEVVKIKISPADLMWIMKVLRGRAMRHSVKSQRIKSGRVLADLDVFLQAYFVGIEK